MESIREVIVVEGRDDTRAIKSALKAQTIETHGFGISKETIQMIRKAYEQRGIIIFTDPDYAGENIRKRLSKMFPEAKHAYIIRKDATKNGDVGIENAKPEDIIKALENAKATTNTKNQEFTQEDLIAYGLVGDKQSKQKRQQLGKALGIGYSNGKGMLSKLNGFLIEREEFLKAIKSIDD